jgi:hypothetical protein
VEVQSAVDARPVTGTTTMPGGRRARRRHAPCSHGPSTTGPPEPKDPTSEPGAAIHGCWSSTTSGEEDPPHLPPKSRLPARSRRPTPPDQAGVAPAAAACSGAATAAVVLSVGVRRPSRRRLEERRRPASRRESRPRPGGGDPRPPHRAGGREGLAAACADRASPGRALWQRRGRRRGGEGPAAGGARVSSPSPRGGEREASGLGAPVPRYDLIGSARHILLQCGIGYK